MDNPEPRAQYLNVVLRQIDRTSLRIPKFQRHFVWGERDVLELLGSIEKGYPIGSVLTWKVDASDDYFSGYRVRPFPTTDESLTNFEVILDGAQRLSTLYGTLRNSEAHEIYRVLYDVRDKQFLHQTPEMTIEPWHIPMDALFDSRRFLHVQGQIASLEDSDQLLPRALDLYSTFQDYQIPIIALSNAKLEDVVEVFRRVNSSGTPLSSVDFVRALTWRSSFDLEETFETFAERYQGTPLEGFTEDFLVRCLAISAGLSLDSRDILQLKDLSTRPEGISSHVAAMKQALDRMAALLDWLGIRGMREVPYEVQRLLLFGMMLYEVELERDSIAAWFWRSTFAEEHQSKPESYVSRLIKQMRDGSPSAALEVKKSVDPDLLASRQRRGGSAVATGFDVLLRRMGARSLLSGEKLSTSDALYAPLFHRSELGSSRNHAASASNLANLVLLSPDDAAEWKALRESMSLNDLFTLSAERTGQADEIWGSQGIRGPLDTGPAELLQRRSETLLGSVIPDVHAETVR